MADVLVSVILKQLVKIASDEVQQRVKLVADVEDEVERLKDNLQAIHVVLEDAEEQQMTNKSIKLWLDRLKEAAYDMEDVLDEWNTALLKLRVEGIGNRSNLRAKVCCFVTPCFQPGQLIRRHDIASKIKKINRRLDGIAEEKNRYLLESRPAKQHPKRAESTSFDVDVSDLVGRNEVKEEIISCLLGETSEGGSELKTISVVGMGGVGKTALSQLVYHDDKVVGYFDKRIWVCVSDVFDESKVAKAIIIGLEGLAHDFMYNLNSIPMQNLLERIGASIKGRKFFLVLDDVWADNRQEWERLIQTFRQGASGSRILLTTRKDTVAKMMHYSHVFSLEKLSEEHCWRILERLALTGRDEKERETLEDIGKEISKRCKGLPLAAKTLGSLLRSKNSREEWESILSSEIWKLDIAEKEIFAPLLLSYYDLPSPVRQCFLYCAVFPKDFVIWQVIIQDHWMAQGYLGLDDDSDFESTAREYFDLLAGRSLFQDFERDSRGIIFTCKLHDIVHDFAQFLTRNEIVTEEICSGKNSVIHLSSKKVRHLAVPIAVQGLPIPLSILGAEKLRTLLTFSGAITAEALRNLFNQLLRLRLLDIHMSNGYDGEVTIPEEIGKLIHLRYLDLAHFRQMKRLPVTVCKLWNLQHLDLAGCKSLEKLPDGMENLISLRFLRTAGCDSLVCYPKVVGKLTSLRDVRGLIMRVDRDDPEEFSIGDLSNLKNLVQVFVKVVGNTINMDEAKKVKLENVHGLRMYVTGDIEKDAILEALNLSSYDLYMPCYEYWFYPAHHRKRRGELNSTL